jgi:pentatricopeptide repeat protein
MDIQEQLTALRQRIAQIDSKYQEAKACSPKPPAFVEDLLSGQVVETEHGRHFECEKLHEIDSRHGNIDISALLELPEDLLDLISSGTIPQSPPTRWAFLDTETTGLAGGTGTYAFLIGVGSIDSEGFRVRQFFMRDYSEEASQLSALTRYLEPFDVLITYNGKSYDQPLLETRYRMSRARHPFARMQHVDLLYGARRLWKLRMESCKLTHLEAEVLGIERQGDVPGALIPYIYFEFVRTGRAAKLLPVFHHNVMDIVSLACLTAIVPEAHRAPEKVSLRHGSDHLGIARWLVQAGRHDEALRLFQRAIDRGLPDHLLFKTMLDMALLNKKQSNETVALQLFTELTESPNPHRARAYEELAKYYEHRERNYVMALEMATSARQESDTEEARHREDRLRLRLRGGKAARLNLTAHISSL